VLKKSITYDDFNGESVTEDFYFNFTRTELMNLEMSIPGGMAKLLEEIIKTQDPKDLIGQFQNIILLSYGQKSEDGKKFLKSQQLRDDFEQTAAYDTLFTELSTDDNAASIFINGIIPKNMKGVSDKPTLPPIPPSS
jgi:hypothetical protein